MQGLQHVTHGVEYERVCAPSAVGVSAGTAVLHYDGLLPNQTGEGMEWGEGRRGSQTRDATHFHPQLQYNKPLLDLLDAVNLDCV